MQFHNFQPTLWSKVFKYQLELGHNTEAYNAMIENPDPSRRKDCLRQLLIMLCDRGDLQSLVDFPYTDLEEEVCDKKYLNRIMRKPTMHMRKQRRRSASKNREADQHLCFSLYG